jgi:membrane protease YdiL (CAAX protease family)
MHLTVRLRALMRRRPVVSYVVLAYALGWSWYVPLALRGDVVRMGIGWPTHLPGLAGPAVAAVVVTALTEGRVGLHDLWGRVTRWRIGWRWWGAVAATMSLSLLGIVVPLAAGTRVPSLGDFSHYTGIAAVSPIVVILVALLVNGLGEETGWRGFAVERLLRGHSFGWTALVVALLWGGWHLPLFWVVDGFRGMGVLAFGWAVGLVAGSVVLTWLYREGHRSVLLVAAWHTAFNLTSATEATGAVLGTVTSVVVIGWALLIVRRERSRPDQFTGASLRGRA